MNRKVKLGFSTDYFPLTKGSYTLTLQNKETVNETEAGTLVRDVKRLGVPHLSVTSTIDDTWFQKIQEYYVTGQSVTISFYSPVTLAEATFDGFIQNLSYELLKDNGSATYWDVSFEVTAY
jgi:hypothetical protein